MGYSMRISPAKNEQYITEMGSENLVSPGFTIHIMDQTMSNKSDIRPFCCIV